MSDLPPRRGTYRLGVYGGMFDPPHLGHLAVVETVVRSARLDRVLVVPSGIPPHRPGAHAPARARLAMCVRAFADLDHVAVSDVEIVRGEAGETCYAVETLEDLAAEPAELGFDGLALELALVIGDDQLAALRDWHRWRDVLELAEVVVVPRTAAVEAVSELASEFQLEGARIQVVPMQRVEFSSSAVRRAAAVGDRAGVSHMVDAAIVDRVLELYS